MDVVYVVARREPNDQLRYSLRSLEAHFPVGRVWVVGYLPRFVNPRAVEYLPTQQVGSKWENSTANLLTACIHDDIAPTFAYFNDDFHVVRPVDEVEPLHRGPVRDLLRGHFRYYSGAYKTGMEMTARLLRSLGVEDPLSYELHVPMLIERARMVEALKASTDRRHEYPMRALHKRTLYGNLVGLGGRRIEDVKVHSAEARTFPEGPYWSGSPQSFAGRMGKALHEMFPTPCSFERGR